MANDPIKPGAPRTSYYKPEEDADWEHFGCEVCGNVFKLPWKEGSRLPFCTGHGDNYAWPTSSEHELELKDYGWIQMKRVEIRVKEASDE